MKKFVSAFIVLAIVLAMLPMAVFAGNGTALYLDPGSDWIADGARFAAYYFEGETSGWTDCVDSDADGIYECVVPEGYSNVIFCRMNPDTTENNWDNKWNQTLDLSIGEGDLYTIENPWNESAEWKATGSWSTMEVGGEGEGEGEGETTVTTYPVAVDDYLMISIPASGIVYLEVDATAGDIALSIYGSGNTYLDNGMQIFYPDMSGSLERVVSGGSKQTLTLGTSSAEGEFVFVSASSMAPGSMNNPAELVMGSNSAAIPEHGNYYYTWTAAEAGQLTLAIDTAACSDWYYNYDTITTSGDYVYGEAHWSSEEVVVSSKTFQVNAGDEVCVVLSTDSYGAATVVMNASFVPGEAGGEGEGEGEGETGGIVIGDGDISVTDVPVDAENPWVYVFTAESTGVLNIKVDGVVAYKIYGLEGCNSEGDPSESLRYTSNAWSAGPDADYQVLVPGEITVKIWAWGGSAVGETDGTISASVTFTPDEVEISKEEYIVSDILLGLGENSLTLDESAITTIYEFCPDETGIYVFTVNNETALVGYWGAGSFFVQDLTENKTNSIEQELNAVGQSIMVGVSGVEGEFTLNVEKKGEAGEIVETEYEDYVNVHVPTEDNLIDVTDDQVITNVDITKPQTVVKDENGFYHLGSVNGPVVYVNLMGENFDITQAFFGGYGALTMRGEYIDAEGNSTNYDFLNAMYDYANVIYWSDYENGLYPMTEDLMMFLKAYGGYQGWYNENLTPFEAIKGEHNADSAWLVACCYIQNLSEYRVVGDADWLGSWDPANEEGRMFDMGNGIYQISFSGVAAGSYELKVTKGSWDENWGEGGFNGGNIKFEVLEGKDVTVTFNAQTGEITIVNDSNVETGDYSIAALVVAMMAATAGAVVLTKKKEF